MTPKTIHLAERERIIAVVPEVCGGPGWHNAVVRVYIETTEGNLRMEDIQTLERTDEMHTLFGVGEVVCRALVGAVPTAKKERKETL